MLDLIFPARPDLLLRIGAGIALQGTLCNSRHEPIGVRGVEGGWGGIWGISCVFNVLFKICWAVMREPKRKNTCNMLLISPYCNHIQKCPEY